MIDIYGNTNIVLIVIGNFVSGLSNGAIQKSMPNIVNITAITNNPGFEYR